jgi:hypothetical protein
VRRKRRKGSRAVAAVSLAAAAIAAGVFTGTLGAGTPEQQHTPPERVMYVAIADTPVIGQPIVPQSRPQAR